MIVRDDAPRSASRAELMEQRFRGLPRLTDIDARNVSQMVQFPT
jgi:hypothetical protein